MIQANVQCHVSHDDYCNDRFTITTEVKVQTKALYEITWSRVEYTLWKVYIHYDDCGYTH